MGWFSFTLTAAICYRDRSHVIEMTPVMPIRYPRDYKQIRFSRILATCMKTVTRWFGCAHHKLGKSRIDLANRFTKETTYD